jgi:hypothetical protein
MRNREVCCILGLTVGIFYVMVDGWLSHHQWFINVGDVIYATIISAVVTVGLQIYKDKRSNKI